MSTELGVLKEQVLNAHKIHAEDVKEIEALKKRIARFEEETAFRVCNISAAVQWAQEQGIPGITAEGLNQTYQRCMDEQRKTDLATGTTAKERDAKSADFQRGLLARCFENEVEKGGDG